MCQLWEKYQQKKKILESWLQEARSMLQVQGSKPETCIREHNAFFDKPYQHILEECTKAGNDIVAVLETPDRYEIEKNMDDIKSKWKVHLCYKYLTPSKQKISGVA